MRMTSSPFLTPPSTRTADAPPQHRRSGGGIQISRDFAIRPDVITYPLSHFAGNASVPSTVDLFINGYRADSAEIKPGPFTLTNVPSINGASEAVAVVTHALGRQASTTIPFYVSSSLLRDGTLFQA